ncbi:unnamed protein product [Linum tenue]|uniref:Uncharacterized protein n=1 Tax=Linum tenue TaxID=586396 RepID=A0AAV0MRM4_9ROSI|nr:unnamed protein product [Linum tenue]
MSHRRQTSEYLFLSAELSNWKMTDKHSSGRYEMQSGASTTMKSSTFLVFKTLPRARMTMKKKDPDLSM